MSEYLRAIYSIFGELDHYECPHPKPTSARGRARRFCSNACRQRAYRRRRAHKVFVLRRSGRGHLGPAGAFAQKVAVLSNKYFPQGHWRRIYSNNPLERLNKEIKRRTNVVGIFPDRDAVIRLVGSLLIEIDDEWQIGRRYFSLASMKELLEPDDETKLAALPIPLAPVH